MWSLFGHSSREVKFRVSFTIHELRGIPFRHGQLFLKVKYGRSSQVSPQVTIGMDNNAKWNMQTMFDVKMTVSGKTNVLDSFIVSVSVKHVSCVVAAAFKLGLTLRLAPSQALPRRTKIRRVGKVYVDLAEFARSKNVRQAAVRCCAVCWMAVHHRWMSVLQKQRLYLLQHADINSALLVRAGQRWCSTTLARDQVLHLVQVTVAMSQTSGDPMFQWYVHPISLTLTARSPCCVQSHSRCQARRRRARRGRCRRWWRRGGGWRGDPFWGKRGIRVCARQHLPGHGWQHRGELCGRQPVRPRLICQRGWQRQQHSQGRRC